MIAVAAGDKVAVETDRTAIRDEGEEGVLAIEAARLDRLGFIVGRAALGLAPLDEVAGQLGLPVDGDMLAGQRLEIDAMAVAGEGEREAVVAKRLGRQALSRAGLGQHVDRSLLQHAGAHARQDVGAARPVDDDGVDARSAQQLAQQQAGGPAADDGDLGAHC